MAESIPSEEGFGRAAMQPGEAPTHTSPSHISCAYYPTHDGEWIKCPHGMTATGAFYNEDYVQELRVKVQRLIPLLQDITHAPKRGDEIIRSGEAEKFIIQMDDRLWLGPIEPRDMRFIEWMVGDLEELTK
jgi:hypothetical protein